MLQKELAKRPKARYDTKTDGSGWLEVSSDGIPLCRIKYNGQFQSNADQNLSDEYRSKIADIQDEISTVREYVGLYEHAPQMKADGVTDYRQLAAFGDTVLAATYSKKNGFRCFGEIILRTMNMSRKPLPCTPVSSTSTDCSVRMNRQTFVAVDFAKGNCETLTYEQERQLDKLQEKLTDGYPSLETKSRMSHPLNSM